MSDDTFLWVTALIVYAGVIVSALGTLFTGPVMMIFLIIFTFMAVMVTHALMDRRR